MKISVVVPAYNRETLVQRTLESIKRQTYRPIQLILVDNGSSDGTLSVLRQFSQDNQEEDDFEILVEEEPKRGATAARNKGAEVADGDWLIFFDSDDEMDESLVAEYARKMTDDVDVVCVPVDIETNGTVWRPFYPRGKYFDNHILRASLSTQRYAMRKSLFEKAGRWNEDIKGWNDWELGVRVLLQNPRITRVSGKPLVHVYSHADSITGTDFSSRHEWWEESVAAARKSIEGSNVAHKDRLLKFIDVKLVTLAAMYKKEGREDLAKALYEKTIKGKNEDVVLRCLLPMIYRYVACGGKKATVLVKLLVR